MAIDLFGWIEVRVSTQAMRGVVRLTDLIGRDYLLYECVFGAGRRRGRRPLTLPRPLPADLSDCARADLLEHDGSHAFHETSWLTAEDFLVRRPVTEMVWPKQRIELLFKTDEGEYELRGMDHTPSLLDQAELQAVRDGKTIDRGRWRYIAVDEMERIQPSADWLLLDGIIARLADRRDPKAVRIVAGFM